MVRKLVTFVQNKINFLFMLFSVVFNQDENKSMEEKKINKRGIVLAIVQRTKRFAVTLLK